MAAAQKKARASGWHIVFIDESGFYLLPSLRRTHAPAGQTPILRTPCRYGHLSVMAAVTTEGQLFTRMRDHSLRSEDSVAFLRHLRGHLPAGKLLVIWDGSPIHRHKAMRVFGLSAEAEPFVFESLPGYAPDLNPSDTGIWHHLKDVALANMCCRDLLELREVLTTALGELRRKPRLIQAAFANAKLDLG